MQQRIMETKMLVSLKLILFLCAIALLNTCVGVEIPSRTDDAIAAVTNEPSNEKSSEEHVVIAASKKGAEPLKIIDDNNESNEIPMEFYQELNNITSVSEFVERFVDVENTDPQLGIQGYLRRSVERAAAIQPKPASCIPEPTVVSLKLDIKDPNIYQFPQCTRVLRCGGCCTTALMSCQPTVVEYVNFEVLKVIHSSKRQRVHSKEIVVVEEHKKCACACAIKEEDCNAYQIYDVGRCSCTCVNSDARQKCLSHADKIWNENDCRCACRGDQSCTTGLVFDDNQCKCVNAESEGNTTPDWSARRRLIVKAVAVDPDNSTIYTL